MPAHRRLRRESGIALCLNRGEVAVLQNLPVGKPNDEPRPQEKEEDEEDDRT
jgi:hypothetical protein